MFWFSLHAHQQNLAIKPFCNPNIGLACVSFDKIKACDYSKKILKFILKKIRNFGNKRYRVRFDGRFNLGRKGDKVLMVDGFVKCVKSQRY